MSIVFAKDIAKPQHEAEFLRQCGRFATLPRNVAQRPRNVLRKTTVSRAKYVRGIFSIKRNIHGRLLRGHSGEGGGVQVKLLEVCLN